MRITAITSVLRNIPNLTADDRSENESILKDETKLEIQNRGFVNIG
jgi:hypothetical protein